jgi:hypothetical protein
MSQQEFKGAAAAAGDRPTIRGLAFPRFYEWLKKEKMVFPKGTKGYTHLAQCARMGPIIVPDDRLAEFEKKYAAFCQIETLFISEEALLPFHILFYDFDLAVDTKINWTAADSQALASDVAKATAACYADRDESELLCIATSAASLSDDGKKTKLGFHFFWPAIFVDIATHLKLRSVLLQFLRASEDSLQLIEDKAEIVNQVVDIAVVKKPKLRKQFSHKADKGVDQDRSHALLGCFIGAEGVLDDGETKKYQDPLQFVLMTSLRAPLPSDEAKQEPVLPEDIDEMVKKDAAIDGTKLNADGKKRGELKLLDAAADPENAKREAIVDHLVFFSDLHEAQVKDIKQDKKKQFYLVDTSSRMCFNRGGEHKSNSNYFVVSYLLLLA